MTRIGITHDAPTHAGECGGTDLHLVRVTEALSELGEVVHMPVDATLPEKLRAKDVDIVYNMARGSPAFMSAFMSRSCLSTSRSLSLAAGRARSP